jgi:hypothetical protein
VARTPLRKMFTIVAKREAQRVVYGWLSVSSLKKNGVFEPYQDLQGDWIPDPVMEEMAFDYMTNSRATKCMHAGKQVGHCVASLPLTEQVQRAFNIDADRSGWLVAMKVTDDATWQRVVRNEFSGFSVGGFAEYE